MKFKILSAVIRTVEAGKQNAGDKFVEMILCEDSMFADRDHKLLKFCPQGQIPAWENAIATNALPSVNCRYEIVETPPYKASNSKQVQNSMKILVELDSDGNPRQSALKTAMDILANMPGMTVLEASSVPMDAAEVVQPAAPVAKFDPSTGLPI